MNLLIALTVSWANGRMDSRPKVPACLPVLLLLGCLRCFLASAPVCAFEALWLTTLAPLILTESLSTRVKER